VTSVNINTMDPNSLAIEFICPICHMLPIDPVLAEDGFIYCKGCIGEIVDGGDSQVISPMTGEPMETTLIYSDTVKETIRDLTECEELEDGIKGAWAAGKQCTSTGDRILDTKKKAKHGDVEHMVILSRWYLFGEQDGVKRDANKGYNWCKLAADQGDMTGKAYQGYCLIRGLGVERDWEDGYELLIEVASQQLNVVGRGKLVNILFYFNLLVPDIILTHRTRLNNCQLQMLLHIHWAAATKEECMDLSMTRKRQKSGQIR